MDLVLLIGFPVLLGVGYLIWSFWFRRDGEAQPEVPSRRREDARDWQRRFGTESLLTENFLQPTQNEILETLYILDHLTPAWETGTPSEAERHFLDELALNFPTLRKTTCVFPLPFAESLPAVSSRAKATGTARVREEEIVAKREKFRMERAHSNALEQIVSGQTGPKVVMPSSLPFRVSDAEAVYRRGNPWPARIVGTAALGAVVFGGVHLLPNGANFKLPPMQREVKQPATEELPVSTPEKVEPSTAVAGVMADVPVTSAPPPTPPPAPAEVVAVAAAAATPNTVPAPPPPATPDPQKAALIQQTAASKQRALGKYPSLAVEGSEINLRFVFRYKTMIQQNSPRLLDPNWPEKLVEECAADSKNSPKRGSLTQILGANH